ncbi:uncharacterized protein LOC105703559 isoform X2 [Orussus abietinus]|nr:uncharacterized protein LOC105703559 isoform X2 [Orussus abietinus]XP_012287470.1 uncharacterized protein LOC105703559 isoform X2 [Orussus abietinus]
MDNYEEGEQHVIFCTGSEWVEQLISEVFRREPLWNSKLPYKERGFKTTSVLWAEVDHILDKEKGTSQAKFKSLRDRFLKLYAECNKKPKSGSAASALHKTTWKYYNQLLFLIPTIECRPANTHLKKIEEGTNFNTSSTELSSRYALKRKKSAETGNTMDLDPFRQYCQAQLEASSQPPDRIGAFCMYLEAELREMDMNSAQMMMNNVLKLLLDTKERINE